MSYTSPRTHSLTPVAFRAPTRIVPLILENPHPKRYIGRFSRFVGLVVVTDRRIHGQTDHVTSVTIGRILMLRMRCGLLEASSKANRRQDGLPPFWKPSILLLYIINIFGNKWILFCCKGRRLKTANINILLANLQQAGDWNAIHLASVRRICLDACASVCHAVLYLLKWSLIVRSCIFRSYNFTERLHADAATQMFIKIATDGVIGTWRSLLRLN